MNNINLKKIIEQFPDCITNGAKLKAILLDTYPEISKAIVNTLVIMANSGIAKEIQDSENITELDKSRWQKKLEDDYGLSERIVSACIEIFTECVADDYDLTDFEIKNNILIAYKGLNSIVRIPDTVISIADEAFLNCYKITDVILPNSIISIGECAFEFCISLTNISVPNGVISIGNAAFSNCHDLKTAVISDSVTSIGKSVFEDCLRLSSIIISKGNKKYYSCGNCIIENESKKLISGCNNSVIPADSSVTQIDDYAFYGFSGLTSMVIPDSVTSIGASAFSGCSGLTSIMIPSGISSIGQFAFYGCSGLSSVTVNSKNKIYHSNGNCIIETEKKELILGCKNSVIPIDGSVTSIGIGTFGCCIELISITLPASITDIGESAFLFCTGLKNITIPKSVTEIGKSAFLMCLNLTEIKFNGTIDQWNNIDKGADYLKDTAVKEILCSDGIASV